MAAATPVFTPINQIPGVGNVVVSPTGATTAGSSAGVTLPLNLNLQQTQTQWSILLNPVLSLAPNSGIIGRVPLTSGVNTISVPIPDNITGWILADIDGPATVYRSAPYGLITRSGSVANVSSQYPTITLTSSASCNVYLWVF